MTDEIHVIAVPDADGLAFAADAVLAVERGAVLHPLTQPPFAGHPIDGQATFYAEIGASIRAKAAALRGAGAPVFAFGRNLGGSLLGHAVARGAVLDGIVLIGAIPSLSAFRRHGAHASARRFRAALEGDTSRIDEIEPLDLTVSLRAIDPRRCLLQVGRDDPYLDHISLKIFKDLKKNFNVEYYDDDHTMTESGTLARRWDFIAGLAAG